MSARDDLAEEISGWPIGSGYYSTSIGTDEAREIADAIIAAGWTPPGRAEGAGELPAPTPHEPLQ